MCVLYVHECIKLGVWIHETMSLCVCVCNFTYQILGLRRTLRLKQYHKICTTLGSVISSFPIAPPDLKDLLQLASYSPVIWLFGKVRSHTYTHMCTYVHIHTRARMRTHTQTHTHTCTHTHTHTHSDPLSFLRPLKLRYFTPREVANLMCFPPSFIFPTSLTHVQCYKVMGNSLNVHVVSLLLQYLLS